MKNDQGVGGRVVNITIEQMCQCGPPQLPPRRRGWAMHSKCRQLDVVVHVWRSGGKRQLDDTVMERSREQRKDFNSDCHKSFYDNERKIKRGMTSKINYWATGQSSRSLQDHSGRLDVQGGWQTSFRRLSVEPSAYLNSITIWNKMHTVTKSQTRELLEMKWKS